MADPDGRRPAQWGLGLLGLGKLGGMVAQIAKVFGMNLIAWSENLTEGGAPKWERSSLKAELFERADILSIHMLLSDRSRGLVQAEDLAHMKPSAILVNTSRGPIVDQARWWMCCSRAKSVGRRSMFTTRNRCRWTVPCGSWTAW